MSNLFISHSSRDNAAAQELQARLEEQGHRSVFLDLDPEAGIQAGVSWERTLYTKLRACRAVVALCSDSYLASQWCFAEIALARMEGKELFVLQIDPWSEQTQMPSILTEEQYIDLRTNKDDGYQRLWNGFKVKGIVPAEQRQWTPGKSPYPGLRAFEEEDAPIFFGRDDEVREGVELLNRVRRQGHPRLVMVLGSSGSGKSSLARAGIVPQLRRDGERWLIVGPFRPGRQPTLELALALSKAFKAAGKPRPWEEILGRLDSAALESAGTAAEPPANDEAGGEQLSAREVLREALLRVESELTASDSQVVESVQRLKEYLEGSPATTGPARAVDSSSNPLAALATELRFDNELPDAKVVLVIDQFEELLGHEDEGKDHPANRFLRLLKGGIEAEDNPPIALGTMRSDFLGMLQRSGPLRGVGFKSLSVGPMSEEGMLKVIEEPAILGEIDLEKPDLTRRLLRETGTSDALPLLAFTLRAMWDRYHEKKRFDVQGYEALGGLHGAIARVADDTMKAALAKSGEGTEKDLRVAFLSLARPAAEGTGWARQPAIWDEMPERVQPMMQQFIEQRLLVKRADGTVEVAHEALFRSWEKLRGWLDANAEGLHLLREIRIDAENWEKSESDADKEPYLWRSGRLARALELRERGVLKLTELDTSFIDASDSEEQRKLAEKEARRKAELEQARKLAEEQRRRAEEQARSALRTKIGAAVLAVLLVVAALLGFYANRQKIAAQDQTRIAIARVWMEKDPTSAALVLLEIEKPEEAAYALPLMGKALTRRLARHELTGHERSLTSADFDHRGERIVTASEDHTARIWPADGSGEPWVLEGHTDVVWSAVFDARGERIVTASADHTARIWPADGAGEILVLRHDGIVNHAAFDSDGERIVTASDDYTARVWRADGTPELVLDHGKSKPKWAAFSPDGNRIVTASRDSDARLWNADGSGQPIILAGHTQMVESAVFSPSGDRILTASRDGTARVWNADGTPRLKDETQIVVPRPPPHPKEMRLYSAFFSPSGDQIVTASGDGTARLWNAADGTPVMTAGGRAEPVELQHSGEITRAVFNPRGDRIVTASKDGTARIWSAEAGREPQVISKGWAIGAIFGPAGAPIVMSTGTPPAATVWETSSAGEGVDLIGHTGRVNTINFSTDRKRIVTASDDKTARVWEADGTPVSSTRGGGGPVVLRHDDKVNCAAFAPLGGRIVTASNDKTARVWEADGTPVSSTRGGGGPVVLRHDDKVNCAAFGPRGRRIVTASDDKTARVWEADGTPISSSAGGNGSVVLEHDCKVSSAAFDPDGDRIVTACDDNTASIWSAIWSAEGPVRLVLQDHEAKLLTASFSPTGDRVVTGSQDETARVWSAESKGEPLVLRHPKRVRSAVFSPEGDRVLTTSQYRDVRIWGVTFEALSSSIREVTAICLSRNFRERTLQESSSKAQERFDRCRKARR